ncbi:GNAT family N-acetyltransferase [Bacillus salacetis]|uniref:GNAT family N-acetyltransferase n=1 Tax=Bacillus salacetis TaxID=2315464 RepID=UPI003BA21760
MTKSSINTYSIRNYKDADADKIAEFDFMAMLAYRYNGDYEPQNIFCAVDGEDNIVAAGHIVPDPTWLVIDKNIKPSDFVCKLNLDISLNEDLSPPEIILEDLFKCLLKRAKELRKQYPEKNVRVRHVIPTEDIEEIDFYLSKGFDTHRTHLIMKRDLTEEIPSYPLPGNLTIRKWDMATSHEEQQYLAAEAKGDLYGVAWSLNQLRWTKNGQEWDTFTVFEGNEVVGSVMTWGLGEDRGATENIFILPEWRRQGIAKAVITEALKFLRDKGKSEATLGVFGDNGKAIMLYRSLGYKMLSVKIEFGLDI